MQALECLASPFEAAVERALSSVHRTERRAGNSVTIATESHLLADRVNERKGKKEEEERELGEGAGTGYKSVLRKSIDLLANGAISGPVFGN